MQTTSGGYTIVEVMIVLAITSVLFFSAVLVFNGQRSGTDFSQAMQDLNSKIQDYANKVSTSSYSGSENYICSVVNGRPLLTNGSGSNDKCLFLGLAIQAVPGQSTLHAYTVLGTKDIYAAGGTDTGQPALNISSTNPEPALLNDGSGTDKIVLAEDYALGAGSTVKSSTASGSERDLVGLYNGLQNDSASASSGAAALILTAYDCTNGNSCNVTHSRNSQVQTCIEKSCGSVSVNQWSICLQDGGSNNTAQLKIFGAPGGIRTLLNFVACT
jgi:type II secretory pathway pseudopilin PulG